MSTLILSGCSVQTSHGFNLILSLLNLLCWVVLEYILVELKVGDLQ